MNARYVTARRVIALLPVQTKATVTVLGPKANASSTDMTATERTRTLLSASPAQNGNVPEQNRASSKTRATLIDITPNLPPTMTTALLYIFVFTSWGLGLLSALAYLSMKLQEHGQRVRSMALENESGEMDILAKKSFLAKVSGPAKPSSTPTIPEELKELMSHSPEHPEVSEIDSEDEIYGVIFKAHSYPPTMEDDDNE